MRISTLTLIAALPLALGAPLDSSAQLAPAPRAIERDAGPAMLQIVSKHLDQVKDALVQAEAETARRLAAPIFLDGTNTDSPLSPPRAEARPHHHHHHHAQHEEPSLLKWIGFQLGFVHPREFFGGQWNGGDVQWRDVASESRHRDGSRLVEYSKPIPLRSSSADIISPLPVAAGSVRAAHAGCGGARARASPAWRGKMAGGRFAGRRGRGRFVRRLRHFVKWRVVPSARLAILLGGLFLVTRRTVKFFRGKKEGALRLEEVEEEKEPLRSEVVQVVVEKA